MFDLCICCSACQTARNRCQHMSFRSTQNSGLHVQHKRAYGPLFEALWWSRHAAESFVGLMFACEVGPDRDAVRCPGSTASPYASSGLAAQPPVGGIKLHLSRATQLRLKAPSRESASAHIERFEPWSIGTRAGHFQLLPEP